MNPLWQFSLDYYRRPGVETECLKWQEDLGADVNLLLMCLWCATLRRALDVETLHGLVADPIVDRWRRDVIGAIRAARRSSESLALSVDQQARGVLSGEPLGGALYRSLLEVELQAERIEQEMLWRWVCDLPAAPAEQIGLTPRQLAYTNVCAYGECLGVEVRDAANVDLLVDALDAPS